MKKKLSVYSEFCYLFGNIFIALSAAIMDKADFGMSMIVAPAYVIYKFVSQFLPFFTFGMAEYTFQAFMLIIMIIILRRFKVTFLLSFLTAVIYGFILDFFMYVFSFVPCETIPMRILFYVIGVLLGPLGVSIIIRTYFSPEVYELFVKEVARKFKKPVPRVKTIYDCSSCLLGLILSFILFGFLQFVGVKWGTVLCALINGTLVGFFTKAVDKVFDFKDAFKLRSFFEAQYE